MNRRNFLRLSALASAAAALPLSIVAKDHKEADYKYAFWGSYVFDKPKGD